MAARFILSLDCEGKWGVADQLTNSEQRYLTDARLRYVYAAILRLLDQYELQATFAFVGLFGESSAGFRRLRPAVNHLAEKSPYLAAALLEIDSGCTEGWHGDWAVGMVGEARLQHEIALHGITHVPWGKLSRKLAKAELELFGHLGSAVRQSQTFIFPRNDVAHVDLLGGVAIEGFRLAPTPRMRVVSLASEFNLLSPPEPDPPPASEGPLPIPAGYFVNWRHGLRRLVPHAVSRARGAIMLKRAEERGEIVHMWLHPENIATAENTLSVLESLLIQVAKLRDLGRCEVLTQLDYVRSRRAAFVLDQVQ